MKVLSILLLLAMIAAPCRAQETLPQEPSPNTHPPYVALTALLCPPGVTDDGKASCKYITIADSNMAQRNGNFLSFGICMSSAEITIRQFLQESLQYAGWTWPGGKWRCRFGGGPEESI